MIPKKPLPGQSLADLNSELSDQWHPTKNGTLTPSNVTPGSSTKVWWKCPKEDDHEWCTSVSNRKAGSACPFCSGRRVTRSNSLAVKNPKLAKEWHSTRNEVLTPYDVTPNSSRKVWWQCPKGDDHEWDAVINDRSKGAGCAICSNYKVVPSNSLSTLNPKLAMEWHPKLNGTLTPDDVHPGAAKKVWWKCPEGDDHVWKAMIYSRTGGKGCPICSGLKVVKSTCLATLNPEIAEQWHPTKNKNMTPHDIGSGSRKKVWWKCPEGDDHEWQAIVYQRVNGLGCPICANQKIVLSNCLASVNPVLAKQWHPEKNGNLTPYDIGAGSGRYVWWKCPKADDHEWRAPISRRNDNITCPICIGRRIVDSNCLESLYPDLSKQWHPTKNGSITPKDVRPGSTKKVWWICNKGIDHIWKASVKDRTFGTGCPFCSPATSGPELRLLCELKSIFPSIDHRIKIKGYEVDIYIPEINFGLEYDGFFWHQNKEDKDTEKSKALETEMFLLRVRERGLVKIFDSDIQVATKRISIEVVKKILKKILTYRSVESTRLLLINEYMKRTEWASNEQYKELQVERNKVTFVDSIANLFPELSAQWHPVKNGPMIPEHFTPGSDKRVWWKCPEGDDHEWEAIISSRTSKTYGCPICSNKKVALSNCLATVNPKLARDWHPIKNGELTPFDVTPGSDKKVWWQCPEGEDHEWEASIYSRTIGQGCPVCSGRKAVRSNSFGVHYPELMQQWHSSKNGSLTPYDVTPGSHKLVWWQDQLGKEWQDTVNHRTSKFKKSNNPDQLALFQSEDES